MKPPYDLTICCGSACDFPKKLDYIRFLQHRLNQWREIATELAGHNENSAERSKALRAYYTLIKIEEQIK